MKNKLIYNTVTSLVLQMVTFISGFIMPKLLLSHYGSEINGVVNSITQFLGIINLAEMGIGQVIHSKLYHPLATNDHVLISKIVVSGQRFYQKITVILLFYVGVLILIYPLLIDRSLDWIFTATLILSMSVSLLSQYLLGNNDRTLLSADQKSYILNAVQIILSIVNIFITIFLIKNGSSIQLVKLVSSLVFLIKPIVGRIYINKQYAIDRKIKFDDDPIKEKWSGSAQYFMAFILDGTDNIVLTLFSTLQNVSIYSVYLMVISGIRMIHQSLSAGLQSYMGNLWALKNKEKIETTYSNMEFGLHTVNVFLFGCTAILIVPFVNIYTAGIADANYNQPVFAIVLTLAYLMTCLKTTYNIVILAAGHFRQTQICHIVASILNISISVTFVNWLGLVGVAIGTLAAMTYQTIWMGVYVSKHLLQRPVLHLVKRIAVDAICLCLIFVSTAWIHLPSLNYGSWIWMAVKVAIVALLDVLVVSFIFYPKESRSIMKLVKS